MLSARGTALSPKMNTGVLSGARRVARSAARACWRNVLCGCGGAATGGCCALAALAAFARCFLDGIVVLVCVCVCHFSTVHCESQKLLDKKNDILSNS